MRGIGKNRKLSVVCSFLLVGGMLALGASPGFGAISYFEVRPGAAKPSPVGTTIPIYQGSSVTIQVNGHGTDFARSVTVSGTNVSARITGRKNGAQHRHYRTKLPLGEVSLRVTARSNARLGVRTVTIRYPVGQDQFKIIVKRKPASGSVDVAGRKPGWPKNRNGLNKLATPFKSAHLFMHPIGVDHKKWATEAKKKAALDVDCQNYRKRPFPYCYKGHVGTDYLLPYGYVRMDLNRSIDVVAVAPGEVVKIEEGNYDRCGVDLIKRGIDCKRKDNSLPSNYVVIKQTDGKYASYQHLQNGSVPKTLREKTPLRRGSRVKCGQKLGKVGSSGRSAYPHLHFQLSNEESIFSKDIIDPYKKGLWISLNRNSVPNGKCPLQ